MSPVLKRAACACALLTGAIAGMGRAAEALPCADYISSGGGSAPLTGHLIGSETRTVTFHVGTKAELGGIGGSTGATYTVSWEVGYYQMSDGRRLAIDCRNYTIATLAH